MDVDMQDASPARAQSAGPGQVFSDQSGQPLRIFVETSQFPYRPKLIRSLRKGGAHISYYPTEADVVLVDLETEAGKQCVELWSIEKVVLEWRWAPNALERGKALLENEDWGGFRVQRNGEDGHIQMVPRKTPKPAPPPTDLSTLNASTVHSAPSASPTPQATQFNGFGIPLSNGHPLLPRLHQQTPFQSNGVALPQNIMSAAMQNPQTALLNMFLTTMQSQSVPNATPNPSLPGPNPLMQMLASQLTQSVQQPGLAASDFMDGAASASSPVLETPQGSIYKSEIPSADSTPTALPSSLKRKSAPLVPSQSSSFAKGKVRAESPARPKKIARSSTTPHRKSLPKEPSPPSPERPPPSEIPRISRKPGEIFITEAGESMVFFVQMEVRRRSDLLHLIKKNGGKIVADIPEADIVVLAPNSKPYMFWSKLAKQTGKPIVQPVYLNDCVAEEGLLDVDPYVTDKPPVTKSRGRRPKSSQASGTTPSKDKRPDSSNKAETEEKVKLKSAKRESEDETSTSISFEGLDTRSPTPPRVAVQWVTGRNLFSAEDKEFFKRYVPALMMRDPDITLTAISSKLYEKAPHHPMMSWRSLFTRFGDDVNTWRKKAHIAHRKAAQRQSTSEHKRESPPPDLPAGAHDQPEPEQQPQPQPQLRQFDDEDFHFVADFFANGGADGISDEEVWGKLSSLRPSRTAAEWSHIWIEHGEWINTEVQRLMEQQPDPDPKTQS